jgi:hypothetical protein
MEKFLFWIEITKHHQLARVNNKLIHFQSKEKHNIHTILF